MNELEVLKQEATELGVEFAQNIGVKKLQEKINDTYEAKEAKTIPTETTDSGEKKAMDIVINPQLTDKQKLAAKITAAKTAAYKTSIVTITDKDQRENSRTTCCTANCSNDYFDLGTRTKIPLNEAIELEQGFIDVLRSVHITFHTLDPKTGLSKLKTIQRYSVIPSGQVAI
jgi:hypothetical protein